jgi:hypothetical protein
MVPLKSRPTLRGEYREDCMTQILLNASDVNIAYGTYRLDEKLSNLLKNETLRVDTNNNGFRENPYAHKDALPIWKKNIPVKKLYENADGFTPEEYSRLTGEPIPNQWWSSLRAEENGKVCTFSQNGNWSIITGADNFSKKGKLITKFWGKTNIVINIIND